MAKNGYWEEKEQDKHVCYFLLCTLPVCYYFQIRGFSELGGVSLYLGSSMDFSSRYFFSYLLSPERVLASTTSFSNNFPRSATLSMKNHLLFLCTWLLLALCNVLVETLMADPYPHLSMALLSLEICTMLLASCFFSSLQASSLCSHSSSQSHSLSLLILVAPPWSFSKFIISSLTWEDQNCKGEGKPWTFAMAL